MRNIRKDRQATEYGGFGVARELCDMRSTPSVFWSAAGNSYVVTRNQEGKPRIASINGIGEIRWYVEDWNRDTESNAARCYFLECER